MPQVVLRDPHVLLGTQFRHLKCLGNHEHEHEHEQKRLLFLLPIKNIQMLPFNCSHQFSVKCRNFGNFKNALCIFLVLCSIVDDRKAAVVLLMAVLSVTVNV